MDKLRGVAHGAALATVLAAAGAAYAQNGTGTAGVAGYYKNLLVHSTTLLPPEQSYTVDLHRLRVEASGRLGASISFEIEYDNEISIGSYLETAQFAAQKNLRPDTYWRPDRSYRDRQNLYARHRLHRGVVSWSAGDTELRAGRQRIGWGTGRFFSPLDRINPLAPTALERDERMGVDALQYERKLGALSRLTAVYAPQRAGKRNTIAGQWHGNTEGIDWSVTGGRLAGERIAGIDIATQLGDAGLRAEATRTLAADRPDYTRAMLGIDYAFANTLTLSAELYYDGAGATAPAGYDVMALFSGKKSNLARRYAGLYASYEFTPLLKTVNYAVVNVDDRSRFVSPTLVYSMRPNLDWTVGLQWYAGGAHTEFGRPHSLLFVQFQHYF